MSFLESPQADAPTAIKLVEGGPTDFAVIDLRRAEIARLIRDEMLASLQLCGGKVKEMRSIFYSMR